MATAIVPSQSDLYGARVPTCRSSIVHFPLFFLVPSFTVVIFVFMVPLSLFTIWQAFFDCKIVNCIEICLNIDLFINLAIITCFPSIKSATFHPMAQIVNRTAKVKADLIV